MNKICFIYTETNGLHTTKEIVSKKKLYCFARLVTINYIIGYYNNNKFIEEQNIRQIVKPRCMNINEETIQYHNITQKKANKHGVEIETIINDFKNNIKNVNIIISHNVDFHLKTILAEAVKYNILLDFNNHLIIDTISFYHDYGYLKLKDLALKLKIKDDDITNCELIKLVFLKLYSEYSNSINN